MDTLFFIIALISLIGIFIFAVLAVLQFIKKDALKAKKQLKLAGVSLGVALVSLTIFGMIAEPTDNSETAVEKNVAVVEDKQKEAASVEAPVETQDTDLSEENKVEESVVTEEKEEIVESTPVSTWQDKVKEVAATDESPTAKYDAIMLYAKDYSATADEITTFEQYIINEYQTKNYISDINDAEYMLSNIFRANVINRHYGQVNSPINDFAFDFYQNTKYTYRGVDAIDSDAVRANERQMDKALQKIK